MYLQRRRQPTVSCKSLILSFQHSLTAHAAHSKMLSGPPKLSSTLNNEKHPKFILLTKGKTTWQTDIFRMKLNLTVKILITGTISYTGLVCLRLRVKDAVFVKRGQLKVLVSSTHGNPRNMAIFSPVSFWLVNLNPLCFCSDTKYTQSYAHPTETMASLPSPAPTLTGNMKVKISLTNFSWRTQKYVHDDDNSDVFKSKSKRTVMGIL